MLAQKLGLDPQVFFDISSKASGQSWSMTSYAPVPGVGPDTPADHDYEGGFAAALMLKDLKLATDAARQRRRLHADGRRSRGALPALRRPRRRRTRISPAIIKMIDDSWKVPAGIGEIMRIALFRRAVASLLAACGGPETSQANNARPISAQRLRRPRPHRAAQRQCHDLLAAAPTKAQALKIMHERHEGMETIGKAIKAIAARARRRLARPRRQSARRPPRSPSCRERRRAGSRAGTGPDVGKTGAKPEIWQNQRRFRRQARRLPEGRAGLQCSRRRAATSNAIKARFARPRQGLQGVPRQVSDGDAPLSAACRAEAAGLGPADPAVPLAARRR